MGRRTILFVILGLVACAGDQPTEPIYEGGGFMAALPPAPAPPTVLTGELGGGTGLGVSTELGFWESPVYATVTVEGALTYSGRQDGYLPGTGQIDAAGILVQSQCDLTVFVSFATSNGGATLPIAPTCWYPARNMGSYSRRMTLQGRVWTYRTAGPPLSCYKGITPCVSYEGTQTVTVTPEEGNLVLTANKTSVAPGGGVYVTAKGVWATDPATTVPMTVREWRWEGEGPEIGGGHTKVCVTYYPNQCIVQVAQSGHVVLEALVNGHVKTEKIWIRVEGGDSVPPPPPPPPPDSGSGDPPPGGGGGGGGGGCGSGCCGEPPIEGLHLAECKPPEPDSILLDVTMSRMTVLPVIELSNFNAITQVALRRGAAINRNDTVTVTIRAKKKRDGAPAAGAQITLHAIPQFPTGGHIHQIADRPTGTFLRAADIPKDPTAGSREQITLVMDSAGTAKIRYRSSGIGGREWIRLSGPAAPLGVRPDSVVLEIRYPGLVAMARDGGTLYQFKQQDPNPAFPAQRHGDNNHWVRPQFRDSLLQVFADFYRRGGRFIGATTHTFVITDAGLEYGGLLDAGDSDAFEWRDPHLTHRTGNDMDIRSKENGEYVFSALDYERLMVSCFPRTHLNGGDRVKRCDLEPPPNTNPPHLHIEGLP